MLLRLHNSGIPKGLWNYRKMLFADIARQVVIIGFRKCAGLSDFITVRRNR